MPSTISPAPEAAEASSRGVAASKSYGEILKSSALIGGSSVLNIGIGILRAKAMAILLGPAGVGLAGLYGSITDLTWSIAGMGVNSSGVRQIAAAAASGDKERVAQTAAVLRRTSLLLGIVGAVLLVAFSSPIARLTFGSSERSGAVALLSMAVLFRLISDGQGALIQGLRRISTMARTGVLGAVLGTLVSIGLVYFFGERGIAPSLVAVAGMTAFVSWWYSRNLQPDAASLSASQAGQEAVALLRLGSAFMVSGLLTTGAAYAVRLAVLETRGLEAAGLYQCAWTLGGLYVGFILQAMGADFYPRLTASAGDPAACNRLVNEQALVGLLLAGPGVMATLTLAPLVIALFYDPAFSAAVGMLRWICLGAALRVLTWPMGFIIIAKGRQDLVLLSETCWTVVYVSLAWLGAGRFGLEGAGAAFFASYVFHGCLTYPIVRRLSGFRWSPQNLRTGFCFLGLIGMVYAAVRFLPAVPATCAGLAVAAGTGFHSLRTVLTLISLDRIPLPIRRLLLPFVPAVQQG